MRFITHCSSFVRILYVYRDLASIIWRQGEAIILTTKFRHRNDILLEILLSHVRGYYKPTECVQRK